MFYTTNQLDQYLVDLTNALEPILPNNIKLTDFRKDKEVYGFTAVYANTDLFKILFSIPSCRESVGEIPTVILKYLLSDNSNTDILTNAKKRNKFLEFVYQNHIVYFNNNGDWSFHSRFNRKSNKYILNRFYIKNTNLPPIESVVNSFGILLNIDPQKELDAALISGIF